MTNSDRFAAFGVQVLLVYPGPPADLDQRAKEFLAKQNELPANLHLVIDPDYKFTNQYGLRWDAPKETAYPTTFLIDRHDVVFFRSAGLMEIEPLRTTYWRSWSTQKQVIDAVASSLNMRRCTECA